MNTNIFVPKRLNVGFQNRSDTYTGKLAYVIYYDQKGKLRKEPSWNSWRDKNIPNVEFDNEPTEGFVLNKKVGGTRYSWNPRQTYTRIYDPRGFEFEITIPNLIWILENCNCIRGKGLEGEFVYGWDGTELVLVPVDSPDYKEIQERNRVIHEDEFLKAKDLVVGAEYRSLDGGRYVYMGKHEAYRYHLNHYHTGYGCGIRNYWDAPLDGTWNVDVLYNMNVRTKCVSTGKEFWFIQLDVKDYNGNKSNHIRHFKSVTRKFAEMVSSSCGEMYPEYLDMLERCREYCPVDYSAQTIKPVEWEDFYTEMVERILKQDLYDFNIMRMNNGAAEAICVRKYGSEGYYIDGAIMGRSGRFIIAEDNLREIFDIISPVYCEQYLENGKLCERRGYFGK